MALQYLDDGGYGGGVNRDAPSILLSRGEVYDSQNMIYDRPGVARTRSGTLALSALGSVAGFAGSLGFASSNDETVKNELMSYSGAGGGGLYRIDQTTGAAVGILGSAAAIAVAGRSVQHFGFLAFPAIGTNIATAPLQSVVCAGQATVGGFTSAQPATVTAGSKTITLTAPDSTANIKVGAVVLAALVGTSRYCGRVTSIVDATHFTVWPIPGRSIAVPALWLATTAYGGVGAARCAASFQNRLLWGSALGFDNSGAPTVPYDRRLIYSILPTEEYTPAAGGFAGTLMFGAVFAMGNQPPPPYNFIDVPGTDPFVAMEPVSDNELLILSARRPVVFRGNLVTQTTTTAQQVTFDISEMDKIAGCSNDHTVQRTPRGVMWAGPDGVFVYTGSDVVNVLEGKMATYWRGLARSTTFALHGSAYLRGHYLVAGTSGGTAFQLICNLQSREYTFGPLTNIDILCAVANPANTSQVFAAQWWDQTGAAPNFTNGQVIRIESILDPFSQGSVGQDSNGATIPWSLTTRTLAADQETQKVFQRATVRYQQQSTLAGVTVTAKSGIDASDTAMPSATIGSLSNTATLTVTAATGNLVSPIVCTTVTHGLQTGDFVDIKGGLGNTHVNGRYRITVLSGTTFSLDASTGNGAYTASSAVAKKVTEQDFMLTATVERGQGVIFALSSSSIQGFELHGLRLAYFESAPVMSA